MVEGETRLMMAAKGGRGGGPPPPKNEEREERRRLNVVRLVQLPASRRLRNKSDMLT